MSARLVRSQMSAIGFILWFTGCVRLYRDGDSASGIFRALHPLTWILKILAILPCAITGTALREAVPTRLSKFWLANPQALQWVTPFTDLNALPARRFRKTHWNEDTNDFEYGPELDPAE